MSAADPVPCTASQIMVARLHAKGYVSNVPLLLRATGRLRQDSLRTALQWVVDRHAILRSVFTGSGDALFQATVDRVGVEAPVIDVSASHDPLSEALAQVGAERRRHFDMADPLRVRAHIFRLGPDDHLVSLLVDHLAADGASLAIVMADWRSFYRALVDGTPCEIPAVAPQYREFALWQHAWLKGDEAERLRRAWLDALDGLQGPATAAAKSTYPAEVLQFQLDAQNAQRLAAICDDRKVKPFVVMLACYAAVLSAGTHLRDLVIGTVRANRRQPNTAAMVGHFANLIPLRLNVDPALSLGALVGHAAAVCAGAYARETLPFLDLAAAAWNERGIPAARLAEFAINFVPFPDGPIAWGGALAMEQIWGQLGDRPPATGRITLYVRHQQSAVGGTLIYDGRTIDLDFMDAFPDLLGRAVALLADEPGRTVGEMLRGFG